MLSSLVQTVGQYSREWTPRDVLNTMFGRYDQNSRSLQNSSFNVLNTTRGAGATTGVSGGGTKGGSASLNGNGYTYDNAVISINAESWNRASIYDRSMYLIHELGHVFNMVSGVGSSEILYDADPVTGGFNDAAQATNRATIKSKCGI